MLRDWFTPRSASKNWRDKLAWEKRRCTDADRPGNPTAQPGVILKSIAEDLASNRVSP